jgi:hypothetical protein
MSRSAASKKSFTHSGDMHFRTRLTSSAPEDRLRAIHDRVIASNMVLAALRGIPRTSELTITR